MIRLVKNILKYWSRNKNETIINENIKRWNKVRQWSEKWRNRETEKLEKQRIEEQKETKKETEEKSESIEMVIKVNSEAQR